ncbi:MAG: hypothetical protein IKU34_11140 [Clostridia bacterium]|nr:hypothetical protein [Clostridia bacterium]
MKENSERPGTEIFWSELALALTIPLIICWSIIPTNILNAYWPLRLLEAIGLCGSILIFFLGIPAGVIGIRKAKRTGKLKTATTALSILNLSAGIIEITMLILVLCAVVFGGVSA